MELMELITDHLKSLENIHIECGHRGVSPNFNIFYYVDAGGFFWHKPIGDIIFFATGFMLIPNERHNKHQRQSVEFSDPESIEKLDAFCRVYQ